MEDIKKELLVLKALTDRLVAGLDTRTRHTGSYEDTTLGEVSFARLYKGDEKALEAISKDTNRKKSQVMRMLIHEAIRLGIKVI